MHSAFLAEAFLATQHAAPAVFKTFLKCFPSPPVAIPIVRLPPEEEEQRCRGLLAAILHLAIREWVQYKGSVHPEKARWADDARHWLFVEDTNSLEWRYRQETGMQMTSFIAICQELGLNPTVVREKVKKLTREDLRKVVSNSDSDDDGDAVSLPSSLLGDIVEFDPLFDGYAPTTGDSFEY
jgi:hypothetical protein